MTAVVVLEGVSRSFPGEHPVHAIRSCDVRLGVGDFLTIMGPSGSGKSSLLNILGLLDRPSSGRYFLLGDDVGLLNETQRSALRGRQIGFVFQSFQLLEYRSAIENVMMASLYRGATASEAYRTSQIALRSVGMEMKADAMPTRLSGGERQRVAIARAISESPALLLADEPTGNLDSRNAAEILRLFSQLNDSGTTIVLITHDSAIASLGNVNLAIKDGVVSDETAV